MGSSIGTPEVRLVYALLHLLGLYFIRYLCMSSELHIVIETGFSHSKVVRTVLTSK